MAEPLILLQALFWGITGMALVLAVWGVVFFTPSKVSMLVTRSVFALLFAVSWVALAVTVSSQASFVQTYFDPSRFLIPLHDAFGLRWLGYPISLAVDPLRLLLLAGIALAGMQLRSTLRESSMPSFPLLAVVIPFLFLAHIVHITAILLLFASLACVGLLRQGRWWKAASLFVGALLVFAWSLLVAPGMETEAVPERLIWADGLFLVGVLLFVVKDLDFRSAPSEDGPPVEDAWLPLLLLAVWQGVTQVLPNGLFPWSAAVLVALVVTLSWGSVTVAKRQALFLALSLIGLCTANTTGLLATLWIWFLLPMVSVQTASPWERLSPLHPVGWGVLGIGVSLVSPILADASWLWLALAAPFLIGRGAAWAWNREGREATTEPASLARGLVLLGLWGLALVPDGFTALFGPLAKAMRITLSRFQGYGL